MKITAAILAALMLFMTAQQPMLSAGVAVATKQVPPSTSSCSKNSMTCKKPLIPEKDDTGNCCDPNFCNPFGGCCCYLHPERTMLTPACFLIRPKLGTPGNDKALSSYIHDIWHPPRIVSFS